MLTLGPRVDSTQKLKRQLQVMNFNIDTWLTRSYFYCKNQGTLNYWSVVGQAWKVLLYYCSRV